MSAAILVLSPRGWAHVGMALATAALTAEDRGEQLPRDVLTLMDTAVKLAQNGPHTATDGHALGAGGIVCDAPLMDGTRCIGMDEAAHYAAVSPRTIRRRCADGSLPSTKIGRRRVLRVRDVRQWIDNQKEVG